MKYHEELGHFANWTSINHQRNHQLSFEPIVLFFEPIKKKVYQIDIYVCFEPTIKRGIVLVVFVNIFRSCPFFPTCGEWPTNEPTVTNLGVDRSGV